MVIFGCLRAAESAPGTTSVNRQNLTIYMAAVFFAATLSTAAHAGTVAIDLVPVGDVGNVADPITGYGSIGYSYSMGKYDVTMSQYTSFLNAVATSSDPYSLYNTSMATATPTYGIVRTSTTAGFTYALRSAGSANVPVTYVNWGDAVCVTKLPGGPKLRRRRRLARIGAIARFGRGCPVRRPPWRWSGPSGGRSL